MVKEENPNIQFLTRIILIGVAVYGEILQYAEQNIINLIVIGTKGKSGFQKLLLGSTSSDIVTYSNCPIVVTNSYFDNYILL
jgi:nucleotide-binding universal stress UspA family protein